MKSRQGETTRNWKKAFFILIAINAAIVILFALFIFGPVPETEMPETKDKAVQESSEFIVRTSKENLNELVNAYLDKLLQNTNQSYSIELKDDVHLLGELPVFSTTVPLSVQLDPIVLEDGNVILKQKSISIGLLALPNKKIMGYMKKYLPMPPWVIVNPKDEEIYVAIDKMEIKSNFQVGVEQFDLEKNDLAFKIRVPYQTLGIESPE